MDRRSFLAALGATAGVGAIGPLVGGCAAPAPPPFDPLGPLAGVPSPTPGRDRWARMPATIHRLTTTETDGLALQVLDGHLPDGLAGHVLFQSLSLLPSDAGFSGDALVWRVDLGGVPTATSRILRTTDHLLSRAVSDGPLRFESHGMMRMGPLGIENQVNTALVQLDGNRVIATIDAGRPWELDPATLRPVGPLGPLEAYRPMADSPSFNRPLCPLTVTSAHPPYDAETGEYYGLASSIIPLPGASFTEVLCGTGGADGSLRRVGLRGVDGAALSITQSAHQMCCTRHHLVIVDAGATIEAQKLFNPPRSWAAGTTSAPRPDTHVYVVDRAALRSGARHAVARRVVIPREVGHLMADHDDSPDRLVLHVPHAPSMDFAEWVMPYDHHPVTGDPVRSELVDVPSVLSYDLGVVARYEVDTRTGAVLDAHAFTDDRLWGSGGLTARNPRTPTRSVGTVFHANAGFPTDLAVQRQFRGFRSHPHRLVPEAEMPWDGVPSCLVRIDHDAGRIDDHFHYPGDRFGWTPTFVPRDGVATGGADGHVVCVVFGEPEPGRSSGAELWIFDASDLAGGPVVRLGHPSLEMPMTLHSLWLSSLATRRADPVVDPGAELLARAGTWSTEPGLRSLVRDEVVPAYEAERV